MEERINLLDEPEENMSGFDPAVASQGPPSIRGDPARSLEQAQSQPSRTPTPNSTSSHSSRGKGKACSSYEVQKQLLGIIQCEGETMKEIVSQRASDDGIDKADKQFLDHIGLSMKRLPQLIKRRLQIKIQSALLEAEEEAQSHASSSSDRGPHSRPDDRDSSDSHASTSSGNDPHSSPTDRDSSETTNSQVLSFEDDGSPQF